MSFFQVLFVILITSFLEAVLIMCCCLQWLLTRRTKTSLQQSLENIENELKTLKKELTSAEPIRSTHPYKSLFISGCNGDARKSFSKVSTLDKDDGEGVVTTLSSTHSLNSTSYESLSQPSGGYGDSDNTHIDQVLYLIPML